MTYKKVILKPGKEESLLRFHPWVFSGAIMKMDKLEEGEYAEVYSSKNQFLGIGYYQKGSITVRILSFEQQSIDIDFWKQRLSAAYQMRLT